MAVADYFQRAAMAASQVLQDFDYDGFIRLLNRHRIGLMIDSGAAKSLEGAATADLAVRLLARFYPKLAIIPADSGAKPEAEMLRQLALGINPAISTTDTLDGVTHCLVIGTSRTTLKRKGARIIYIGSSNWVVKLSMKTPVGCGVTKNPFAAGAAACLGVANLFRIVFAKQLVNASLDGDVAFSLLTLDRVTSKKSPAYKAPDVGRVFLAGAGAIGSGTLWALGRSGARGVLNIIDPQRLELSNMQRYVMAIMDDVEKFKTALAAKWLSGANGITVSPHTMTWDEFSYPSDWRFERVLVALDSAEARIGVQASLPKWVANAYTLNSGIGVSRHHFSNNSACLACLYLPAGVVPSEDVLVASALGFQTTAQHPEIMEIRRRLDRGEPCERAFLERIAAKKGISFEKLLPFENHPLRDLYQQGVCGGQIIGIDVDGRETRAEVPMAFQSAMAGILLAAELVLDASGARDATFPAVTRYDLHRALPEIHSVHRRKDKDGRCLCQDPDYIAAYHEKYAPVTARRRSP
jgi:hypothetical protein